MKVLIVASFAESLLNFRGPLINALCELGHEVHVAAPDATADSAFVDTLQAKMVRVHDIAMQRTGMNPWQDLKCFVSLYRLMSRVKPDVVLSYTIKPVIYGMLAARIARVPNRFALITGLGYSFSSERSTHSLVKSLATNLYRLALSGATKVFFQNPDDRQLFLTQAIVQDVKKTEVVNGSGIDVQRFTVVPFPESPVFLLIARLLGDKGIREYANAAAQVKLDYPQAVFRLVGWIDDSPNAIAATELDRWIAAGTIEYVGRLQDVRPAIADCSVYVLPSYREGTPRTVLEAMAMGRPVITTDAPGCRETVVSGQNGYLVPVKSTDDLAQAMIRFLAQPQSINQMGRVSRAIAESKYDVDKVNQQLLEGMGLLKE